MSYTEITQQQQDPSMYVEGVIFCLFVLKIGLKLDTGLISISVVTNYDPNLTPPIQELLKLEL